MHRYQRCAKALGQRGGLTLVRVLIAVAGLLAAIVLALGAYYVATEPELSSKGLAPTLKENAEPTDLRARREAFFQQEINPLLSEYRSRNWEAQERALVTLNDHFHRFRQGIPTFTEDLVAWGTRGGLVKRAAQDTWDKYWNGIERDRVGEYVTQKFEGNIISEEALKVALADSIDQFRTDIEANRNQLLASVESAVKSSSLESHHLVSYEKQESLQKYVISRIRTAIDSEGEKSLAVAVLSNTAGELGGYYATKLMFGGAAYLVATYGSPIAGVTGGTAAGAASGSAIGPWGTFAGVAAGFVVGIIIDWWMTTEFQERLQEQCNVLVDDIHAYTESGSPDSDETASESWPGLRRIFSDAIKVDSKALESALHQGLLEAA